MKEQEFTNDLITRLAPRIKSAKIETGRSVLYDMPIGDNGVVNMGVDSDSGEAIRGRGTGFEQDILIFEECDGGQTALIPRVIAEVKLYAVTTHDAIVYSYKAECIKRVYPFCRYGMILGGMRNVPGRVVRHGRHFDFVCAVTQPLTDGQSAELSDLLESELETSRRIGAMLRGKLKPRTLHRSLQINE